MLGEGPEKLSLLSIVSYFPCFLSQWTLRLDLLVCSMVVVWEGHLACKCALLPLPSISGMGGRDDSFSPSPIACRMSQFTVMIRLTDIALIPPTVYYSKVGFELAKLVFRGQSMQPP